MEKQRNEKTEQWGTNSEGIIMKWFFSVLFLLLLALHPHNEHRKKRSSSDSNGQRRSFSFLKLFFPLSNFSLVVFHKCSVMVVAVVVIIIYHNILSLRIDFNYDMQAGRMTECPGRVLFTCHAGYLTAFMFATRLSHLGCRDFVLSSHRNRRKIELENLFNSRNCLMAIIISDAD